MILQKILLVFTIIGGINWGLIGFFDFNLVEFITNNNYMFSHIIYAAVGVCAIINIYLLFAKSKDVM